VRQDDVHLAANQFGGETREPFVFVLGESVFKDNVLAFDLTEFAQAGAETQEHVRVDTFASGPKKPDPPHLLRLLPLGGERRGEETTSDHAKEGSPLHRCRIPWRSLAKALSEYSREGLDP
jgi:hypothetical protein